MSDVYSAYKPLRNQLRRLNLAQSLEDVWKLSRYIRDNAAPPIEVSRQNFDLRGYIYPWDLPTIAREVILHADPNGAERLNTYAAWAKLINAIKHVNEVGVVSRISVDDVLGEFHRISHQQFPWQERNHFVLLLRYLKVFGSDEMEPLVKNATGFNIREFFLLGMWLTVHLQETCHLNAAQDFTIFGISKEKAAQFFLRLSSGVGQLRTYLSAEQSYDDNWEFAWNRLGQTPLIGLDIANPQHLHCPVPDLLLRRISQGLYYEIVRQPQFSSVFGGSFQNYIGEIFAAIFSGADWKIFAEQSFHVGRNLLHGADWVVSDTTANLFVECKAKRMNQLAKSRFNRDELDLEIATLAKAVVQHYKNILRAEAGETKWVPNGLKSCPLIVTLEDWFLFGPMPQALLKQKVLDQLAAENMDSCILQKMPYAIMSSRELERMAGIIHDVGIKRFFEGKANEPFSSWMWPEYARESFPKSTPSNIQKIFWLDWKKVFPAELLDVASRQAAVSSSQT